MANIESICLGNSLRNSGLMMRKTFVILLRQLLKSRVGRHTCPVNTLADDEGVSQQRSNAPSLSLQYNAKYMLIWHLYGAMTQLGMPSKCLEFPMVRLCIAKTCMKWYLSLWKTKKYYVVFWRVTSIVTVWTSPTPSLVCQSIWWISCHLYHSYYAYATRCFEQMGTWSVLQISNQRAWC